MSKTKILIVEDEQIIAMALEETLVSLGYHVIAKASSGEEAIQLITDHPPDLILMDIMLGDGYDGIQTAQIVDRNFKIPVIFLTALSDESTLQNIKVVNPFGYLIKPCDDRELVAAIEVACARQRKELAIAMALEKEQALRDMKAKFMSMLSHEFSNTLNVISMAHQMLVENANAPIKASSDVIISELEPVSLHKTLETGINQMHRLIQEAAKIAKEEFYGFRFLPQLCDPIEFCQALVRNLNVQYQASHQIDLVIDSSLEEFKEGTLTFLDHNLLHHILTNLISNAVKYSPIKSDGVSDKTSGNGATIHSILPPNHIHFLLSRKQDYIIFQIRDYGIGIPPEMLQNLFQPFNRGYNVGRIEGTGLGLALVKQCIDLHHGAIEVDSELNCGSTFTVSLPYNLQPTRIYQ
ncbi:MAG: ATP-binding protein [Pseudanabaenaceae cyanobacterium]|jgi:signal transduction histidine kinase